MREDDGSADGGIARRPLLKYTGALLGAGAVSDGIAETGTAQTASGGNASGGVRQFTVHAVEVDIVYNRIGLHQPNGAMYVLEENLQAVRQASGVRPDEGFVPITGEETDGVDTSVIEPLTIRANQGETVEITFVNDLDQRASMHQTGLPLDPKRSDGMNVGENPDTTVPPGGETTYRWEAAYQGGHFFYDGAHQGYNSPDERPEDANHLARGLFGTLVVEPPGATWSDPVTGGPLESGTKADVHDPNFTGTSYREFVPHYFSPDGVYLPDGSKKTWPDTGVEATTHTINYRAEGVPSRVDDEFPVDEKRHFYSSWPNGDPGGGDNVFSAYKGDPLKLVPVGASLEENHVHHLHNHRWKTVPTRTDSDTIDAQTLGLGASYPVYLVAGHGLSRGTQVHDPEQTVRPNMDFLEAFRTSGAGYVHGGAGDILFHCHLFPHYAEGMWAIMRIHDKQRPDLQPLPNTRIVTDPSSVQLPLSDGILGANTNVPGFPDYVPGTIGQPIPKPPSSSAGATDPRSPTAAESAAGFTTDVPGAPYNDPVVDDTAPERDHTIHVMDGADLGEPLVYNDEGDYDPEALVYVHENDVAAARNGDLNPEPLILRANVGDAVNLTVVNESGFPITIHPHFVGFDPTASDSTPSIGWNYEQSVEPGEERTYRWYADEEGAIFFHDHTVGTEEAQHGTFAGLVVEPEGSRHLDPYSGEPLESGTQAIIENPDGNDFREFALHYNDFVPLKDGDDGSFVNPQREHNKNLGTQSINNRNAPYHHRDDEDPAYVHSSAVHGDPPTPLLEAYSNDPIRIRLFQGAWEEQHNFQIHGRQVKPEGLEEQDTVSQIIGPSEAFTFMIDPYDAPGRADFERMPNPAGLPVQDYMYGSGIVDDRFTGMWGIHRVFDAAVPHLEPLPDRGTPDGRITADQLRRMGHSAPFVGIDRLTDLGQRARLLYEEGDDRTLLPDTFDRQNPNVGDIPPKAPDPGDPCPDLARTRRYDVTAIQTDIPFNDHGDHDPHGIVFALDWHVDEMRAGTRHPEPLTLRANQGDCIEVTLRNEMPADFDDDHVDPPMRVPRSWSPSSRVSLHPQRITYDPNGSDGATVGFNFDGTVGPGEEITYRWYADDLYDNMVLTDEADVRGHRHHGAYGNLVIEPRRTVWLDSRTGELLPAGVDAMLKQFGSFRDVREYTLSMSDGRYAINRTDPTSCIVPGGEDATGEETCNEVGGFEDSGHGAINNRAEPFVRRFADDPAQHKVYDSDTHGDPGTVLRAEVGDPVKFLVHQPADKARGMSVHLSGHQWRRWRNVDESPVVGVDDRLSPGKGVRLGLTADAGGLQRASGDYVFMDTKQRRRLESGLWGIFRVLEDVWSAWRRDDDRRPPLQRLPDRAETDPPEGRPGWNVARIDVTGEGRDDLVISVPASDVGAKEGGAVYLFRNRSALPTDLASADLALLGTEPGQRVGRDVDEVGRGASRSVAIGDEENRIFSLPTGEAVVEAIEAPADTPERRFLDNTTNSDLGAVHAIDDLRDGLGGGGGGGSGPAGREGGDTDSDGGGTDTTRDLSGSSAGSLKFLTCGECGQQSALAGEASLWREVTEATEDADGTFECTACGTHRETI